MSINSKLVSAMVLAESGVTFGTSGARGLVTQFTADVCAAFTVAFTLCMKRNFSFQTVAIAIDNRPSSYAMATACSAALEQLGVKSVYYGVIPTPALAYVAMEDCIPAIMVTGSHIPFDRNGLKFYRPDGEISKADEIEIITEEAIFSPVTDLPELIIDERAAEEYIQRYTSLFDTPWLTGKRIGIYEHSSAGRDIYHRIFQKLGAEIVSLGRSDEFVPIDTEAVSEEDKSKALEWSKKYDLDSIFSTDGDGDRPLISDEKGNWLRGDILGLLSAEALGIEALAVPVSCNTSIEQCNKFKQVNRTKIGSPFVIAEFDNLAKTYSSVAGFEANGGFLLGSDVQVYGHVLKALPTRDAILPAIMLLAAANNSYISSLVRDLPHRFTHSDRIQNFATKKSQEIISNGKSDPLSMLSKIGFEKVAIINIDETDGLRLTLDDGKIIHLRPSGNAPELRCYVEADSYNEAKKCVLTALNNILEI